MQNQSMNHDRYMAKKHVNENERISEISNHTLQKTQEDRVREFQAGSEIEIRKKNKVT